MFEALLNLAEHVLRQPVKTRADADRQVLAREVYEDRIVPLNEGAAGRLIDLLDGSEEV